MTDLLVGGWRGGLDNALTSEVLYIEERRDKGFRLLPYERCVSELAQLLDGYDAFAAEILTEDCCHVEPEGYIRVDEEPLATRKRNIEAELQDDLAEMQKTRELIAFKPQRKIRQG